jgi:hypothetical protein
MKFKDALITATQIIGKAKNKNDALNEINELYLIEHVAFAGSEDKAVIYAYSMALNVLIKKKNNQLAFQELSSDIRHLKRMGVPKKIADKVYPLFPMKIKIREYEKQKMRKKEL